MKTTWDKMINMVQCQRIHQGQFQQSHSAEQQPEIPVRLKNCFPQTETIRKPDFFEFENVLKRFLKNVARNRKTRKRPRSSQNAVLVRIRVVNYAVF